MNHFDVVDRRSGFRLRLWAEPGFERHGGFVIDQIREHLHAFAALFVQRTQGIDVFYRAFLATEAGDIAGDVLLRRDHIDKGAGAVVGAEITAGAVVVTGGVIQCDGFIQTNKGRVASALGHTQCFKRRAQSASFTGMRVNVNLGIGHAFADVIDLGLDRRQILLSAALQYKNTPQFGHARHLHHVLPDVFRQHQRQPGQQFFGVVAFFLEVDSVRVEEHRTAVAEGR